MKKTILESFSLKDHVVILTGSSGFLGREFAYTISDAGGNVILVDKETKKNKKLESDIIKKYKTKPMVCNVDITNKIEVSEMVKTVIDKYKKINSLVNNAVFHPNTKILNVKSTFDKFPLELWEQSLSINLTGPLFLCQEIGKFMKKEQDGTIVNISSIYGMLGADQRIYGKSGLDSPISYAVTKGGILNFTKYLAAYWNRNNIRVNTLSLGGVENRKYMSSKFIHNYSEKTILGRMAKKDEYNAALLFLLSNASKYMTGSNLVIDGGWTAW